MQQPADMSSPFASNNTALVVSLLPRCRVPSTQRLLRLPHHPILNCFRQRLHFRTLQQPPYHLSLAHPRSHRPTSTLSKRLSSRAAPLSYLPCPSPYPHP